MQSTTGINLALSDNEFAIIGANNMCPLCGSILELDSYRVNGNTIKRRYICKRCGLIIPLRHDENNPNKVYPCYDKSIKDFINGFGKDIREKRLNT